MASKLRAQAYRGLTSQEGHSQQVATIGFGGIVARRWCPGMLAFLLRESHPWVDCLSLSATLLGQSSNYVLGLKVQVPYQLSI